MSTRQTGETTSGRRNARAASVFSGNGCTDRALWQLSLVLAEIAASSVQRDAHPPVLDAECEDGNEQDVPDE